MENPFLSSYQYLVNQSLKSNIKEYPILTRFKIPFKVLNMNFTFVNKLVNKTHIIINPNFLFFNNFNSREDLY